MALDPLSFAALATSGPLWDKGCKPPVSAKQLRRQAAKQQLQEQQRIAENKLRRSQEAKARYAAKKRQEMREALREKS